MSNKTEPKDKVCECQGNCDREDCECETCPDCGKLRRPDTRATFTQSIERK